MTLAVLGLSQVAVSCSDDDDDNKSEQRNPDANPMDTEETNVAWRWLSALTDAESLPTNWSSKTWEPIVGIASENNANTRIVVVNTIDEARQQFSDLALALKDIPSDYWVGLPQQQIYATQADIDEVEDVLDGIAQTEHLISQNATIGVSQAQRCHDYKPDLTGGAALQLGEYTFSGWFLPSAGQWIMAAEGLGAKWQNARWTTSNREVFQLFQNAFTQAGLTDARLTEGENMLYWTSTQRDFTHAWSFGQALGIYSNTINVLQDNSRQPARSFIAFTVD